MFAVTATFATSGASIATPDFTRYKEQVVRLAGEILFIQ
jgi:hypothetical protein